MASARRRSELRRERRQQARNNWKERHRREEVVNAFVESESDGDIYGWQEAEGFGVETERPYIDSESGVLITPHMPQDVQDTVIDMGLNFNRTPDEKRFSSLSKRYNDEDNNQFLTWKDYDLITNILGNKLYLMLKEAQYLDSDQIIDEIMSFDYNATPEDIERALLSMVTDINNIETKNVQTLIDAMDLGFSLEEALELTDMDMEENLPLNMGMAELSRRLTSEVAKSRKQKELEEDLRRQGENL